MAYIRNLTIRKKLTLILMLTSATAVLMACLPFYAMVVDHYRQSYRDDLTSLAKVLGYNCQAALAFNIPEDADKVLESLKARPSISFAEIHDNSGYLFAVYGDNNPVASASNTGTVDQDEQLSGFMKITQDITLDNNIIGTLSLYDDMRQLHVARKLAVSILFPVVFIALGIAFILASLLQKFISKPISDLVSVSHRISENQDYSMRARKHGEDELGRLVDAFNNMLDLIEKRDSALRESEKRFRTLVDQAVDAFFLFDTDGNFVDVNRQACNSLGYNREELLSMTISDIDGTDEAIKSWGKYWECLASGDPVTIEAVYRRKDGTSFPVEVGLGLLELGGQAFILGLAREISERKLLEEQLRHAQKMEAIGRLSGGVAHDFNNILTTILGYSEMAMMKIQEDASIYKDIKAIHTAGERAAALTRQLLAFSRKQVMEMRVINLNDLIANMGSMLARLIGEDVEMEQQMQASNANIMADAGQIEQIVMNLAVNARDAMPYGGRLVIETDEVELDENYAHKNKGIKPGSYIMLSITDTGTGMSQKVVEKIFEPFFTTKKVGKGTGLGLATVYGIVKQHNGQIFVYSEPDIGTTFKIYFPAASGPVENRIDKKMKTMAPGTEAVLVVDDEPSVLRLISDTLEPLGYRILKASCGKDALAICEKKKGKIDLLLTDVIMPGMNGWELAKAIKAICPNIKLAFTSGYTDNVITHLGVLNPEVFFLSKPLLPSVLTAKLREILDKT